MRLFLIGIILDLYDLYDWGVKLLALWIIPQGLNHTPSYKS